MVSVIHTVNAGTLSDRSVAVEAVPALNNDIRDVLLTEETLQSHPLGVKPGGNALTAVQDLALSMGIFGRIPDSLLLLVLEFLDEKALLNISHTCKGLFAFATHDQLWRDLALRNDGFEAPWRGSWRATLLRWPRAFFAKVDCQHLYSDALYRPFQCTNISLHPFASTIPGSNQISRLTNLGIEEFREKWSDKPFILTEPVKHWKLFQDWDEPKLLKEYGNVKFRAEAVDWTLSSYTEYMNDNQDESPLYLFDRAFAEKMKLEIGEGGAYQPPQCFAEDLFMLLQKQRPDHRWLIIGPERSGSTFHKDPNATSAWNAVIRGYKYWIMFPNAITPPGVYVSDDQSEVTSPLSIVEWLLSFHAEARRLTGCIEGICGPGEVLHIPSGWWHLVVNLEPTIAITQNFVPQSHLRSAVNFLKNKADQVSGFRSTVHDPYALFMQRLQEMHPELYDEMQSLGSRKRRWEDIVHSEAKDEDGRGGFSFGFGDDDREEE